MAELPQHPEADGAGDQAPPRAAARRVYMLWAAGVGLVVLMLVLHVAGVFGPGTH
jgi:hypothetical protein